MRRRRFLAALPFAGGLSGCLTEADSPEMVTSETADGAGPSTDERTDTPTGTPVETSSPRPGRTVPAVVRTAYRYSTDVDSIGVTSPERAQFAFVFVPDRELGSPPGAFALELGDERFEPTSSVQGRTELVPVAPSVYTDDNRAGALRFDVPAIEAADAALVIDGRRYLLSNKTRADIATPLDLQLESVDAPDSAAPDEYIRLSVTVSNEGERKGIYLAAFRRGGLPKTVDVAVPPGETATGSVTYETYYDEGSTSFVFISPDGDQNLDVAIDAESGGRTTETEVPAAAASPDPFY